MDFSLSEKHRKDVEARRREAKRKLDERRKDEKLQAAMESELREREDQRLKEEEEARRRAEAEALLNDGVRFQARLRPVPLNRPDDRLTLPASALEALEQKGALDGGLLTFAVALPSGMLTHAGVAEFTAEEGTVGVPPRVALCLTKGAGLGSLAQVGMVEVRFVRLPRAKKCTARLQPRGEGFHVGGLVAVRMDLEHILQQSLHGHIALTEGDWLPIRHNGVTYELVVRELLPEPQLALLDTDLEVDILPSEQTEADLQEQAEARAREEAARRAAEERAQQEEQERLRRAEQKAASLGEEPAAGADVVQLMLRLPEGGRMQRRFLRTSALSIVLDWVESDPASRVEPGQFCVVQKWPGHCRELGFADASKALTEFGFGRQEALFLQRLDNPESGKAASKDSADVATDAPQAQATEEEVQRIKLAPRSQLQGSSKPTLSSEASSWAAAEEQAHEMLDRRLEGKTTPTAELSANPTLQELRGQELVDVFERLVALGMKPQEAAVGAKRFASQLRELGEMGFSDWPRAVRLLEKYNGRLLRVANLMAEEPEEIGSGAEPMDIAPPPARADAGTASPPQPAAPAPQQANQALSQPGGVERKALPPNLEAKFRELVNSGVPANEAAVQAITLAKASSAAAKPEPSPQQQQRPQPQEEESLSAKPSAVGNYDTELAELAAMGFTDVERNGALLRKYAGRMERVINALCEPA